jgi:hypothetical protein
VDHFITLLSSDNKKKYILENRLFGSLFGLWTFFSYFVINFFASRVLPLFFVACFFCMQLSQIDDFEPLQQEAGTFYAVEFSEIDGSSAAISRFFTQKTRQNKT